MARFAHRVLPACAALLLLAVPSAHAAWVQGATVAGPDGGIDSASVRVALAPDGTGLLAYLANEGGQQHLYGARLQGGVWSAPQRLDDPALGNAARPRVSASSGGSGVVVFTQDQGAGPRVVANVLAAGLFRGPARISGDVAADYPDVARAPNGVAVAVFQQLDGITRRLRVARLAGGAWTLLPQALDSNPVDDAGGPGRGPEVDIDDQGNATVVWGQKRLGQSTVRIWARRLTGAGLAGPPAVISPESFAGFGLNGDADGPDIAVARDGRSGMAVFRQAPGGLPQLGLVRVFVNRFTVSGSGNQVFTGSELADEATSAPPDGDQQAPRVEVNGDGDGQLSFYHRRAGSAATKTFTRALRAGSFKRAQLVGASSLTPLAVPALADDDTGAVALLGVGGGHRQVFGRRFAPAKGSSRVRIEPPEALSDPARGDPGGLDASADALGDVAVAFGQGSGSERRIQVAFLDVAPTPVTPLRARQRRSPSHRVLLRWRGGRDGLGGASYSVQIDGRLKATGLGERSFLTRRLRRGRHGFQVSARDGLGQAVRSRVKRFRVR